MNAVKTPSSWPFPVAARGMVPAPPTWARPLEDLRRARNLAYDAMARGDIQSARAQADDMQLAIHQLRAALEVAPERLA